MVVMHRELDARIRRLVEAPRDRIGPSCPAPGEWASLAAGIAPPNRREDLLAHATACDACAALLRELIEDFTAAPTEQELSDIASLPTAKPAAQEALAKRMSRASKKKAPSCLEFAKAAILIVGAAASWYGYVAWRLASSPAKLLAAAYTEQRPFDFRIPAASHAPVRVVRGLGFAPEPPAALQEAEPKIAGSLQANPHDPKALTLRGRAAMLTSNPDEAVATLIRALNQSRDARIMAELGLAYALRAEASSRTADYNHAIEYLDRALKADPGSVEPAFNRALVYERLGRDNQAIEEWRRYLTIETDAAWAEEARRRLQRLLQRTVPAGKP